MNWTATDARRARECTQELINLAEQGVVSWEQLARDAIGWMSEADVKEFAAHNDYPCMDEDEDEEEHDLMDDVNYVGHPIHY